MINILQRASFTVRLIFLAVGVLFALVVINYIALLELPVRVAQDSVEIALRENVQSLNAVFAEERSDLRDAVEPLVSEDKVRSLAISGDLRGLSKLVSKRFGRDFGVQFTSPSDINGSGVGVIYVPIIIQEGRFRRDLVFYRLVDNKLLDRAANAIDNQASFAVDLDGELVASSDRFPKSISLKDAGSSVDPGVAKLTSVRLKGKKLHLYSRVGTSDERYRIYALSTKKLERIALAEIRSDVRNAIIGMTIASIGAFLILVFFTNSTVRKFSLRVRALADGDYGTRLFVRGSDAFAELASSVNRLSKQLKIQLNQLEDTANAFRRTLETLEEGICVWSDDGEIIFWNRGAEQLTGLARERATIEDSLIAFLYTERTQGMRRITLPIRRMSGGLVVDLVVTAMPGGGIVQTFRDTTMAEKLQQTQQNFMATAAHELRTPITAILGFADTLVNPDIELSDSQRIEFQKIIREHANQLQRIADAFFTNHQLANERVEVSLERITVQHCVNNALGRIRKSLPNYAEKIAQITVDVSSSTAVIADRRALIGVLVALLENALKYGDAPYEIIAQDRGSVVAIMVTNAGQGIEAHHHGRLYDPFYRVDVDMRSGIGGAGLGLFTAHKLIEAMHGAIRLQSVPMQGATFTVELPIASNESTENLDSVVSNEESPIR